MRPPPDPLPDDEWARLEGGIAVASSPQVRAAFAEARQRFNNFGGAVFAYQGVLGHPQQTGGAGMQMEESRTRADEAINEAERIMQAELANL